MKTKFNGEYTNIVLYVRKDIGEDLEYVQTEIYPTNTLVETADGRLMVNVDYHIDKYRNTATIPLDYVEDAKIKRALLRNWTKTKTVELPSVEV